MAAKVKDFNAQDLGSALWGMATTGWVLPEASDSLCRALAAKVQDFNAQEFANTQCALDPTNALRPWPQ